LIYVDANDAKHTLFDYYFLKVLAAIIADNSVRTDAHIIE